MVKDKRIKKIIKDIAKKIVKEYKPEKIIFLPLIFTGNRVLPIPPDRSGTLARQEIQCGAGSPAYHQEMKK